MNCEGGEQSFSLSLLVNPFYNSLHELFHRKWLDKPYFKKLSCNILK